MAFSSPLGRGIDRYMTRKAKQKPPKYKPTYLKAWREFRGLTQRQLVERLDEIASGAPADEPHLRVPLTTASISRIENGEQPYTQAAIEAFAAALDTDPASVIGRDPTKEGKVISMIERLGPMQLEQAERVLAALFERSGTQG